MTFRLSAHDVEEVNELTRRFEAALRPLRLEQYAAPRNLDTERDRTIEHWRRGQRYEPRFEHLDPPPGLEDGIDEVLATCVATHPVSRLLVEDLERTRGMVQALRARDGDAITALTVAKHGALSAELVSHAVALLAQAVTAAPEEASVSAEQAAEQLQARLQAAGLAHWDVVVDRHMSARMSVRSIESVVRVRPGTTFSPNELDRLAVHELGTHVARAENGRRQPLRILGLGIPGYLATEEGLAAWHEMRWAAPDPRTLRRYALRVIAAHEALQHGFFDTFTLIVEHTDPDEAFSIVQRAKRGFADTAQPGAHVKDQVYLAGLLAVTEHLVRRPEDHHLLMSGKVGLQHLGWLQALKERSALTEPALLPQAFCRV